MAVRRRGRRRISRGAQWGLFGAVLLAAGCFAPIAALPVGGDASLLGGDSVPARLILVAALSSVALVLLRRRRALLITGTFAGLMVLVELLSHRSELVTLSGSGPADSALLFSFSHEWGWAPLVIGVALLLLSGLTARRRSTRSAVVRPEAPPKGDRSPRRPSRKA